MLSSNKCISVTHNVMAIRFQNCRAILPSGSLLMASSSSGTHGANTRISGLFPASALLQCRLLLPTSSPSQNLRYQLRIHPCIFVIKEFPAEPCSIYSLTEPSPSQQHPEANLELCLKVRTACGEISLNSAKALRELSAAIRTMTVPSAAKTHMSAAIKAARGLRAELAEDDDLAKVIHVAVVSSLLSELVLQTKKIAETVDNLARAAHFKNPVEDTQKDVVINVVS